MFNGMYDSYKALLLSFKKKSKSVLDNANEDLNQNIESIQNQEYQPNTDQKQGMASDRFTQSSTNVSLLKSHSKHKSIKNIFKGDKWDKIRKQLPENR